MIEWYPDKWGFVCELKMWWHLKKRMDPFRKKNEGRFPSGTLHWWLQLAFIVKGKAWLSMAFSVCFPDTSADTPPTLCIIQRSTKLICKYFCIDLLHWFWKPSWWLFYPPPCDGGGVDWSRSHVWDDQRVYSHVWEEFFQRPCLCIRLVFTAGFAIVIFQKEQKGGSKHPPKESQPPPKAISPEDPKDRRM